MAARSQTILIVEDEPAVRKFVAATLARMGFGIIEAGSTQEALSAMQAFAGNFALVISDIGMPGGSGLDFANEVDSVRPGTPILYMSGMVHSVAVEAILQRDPGLLLMKPFTADDLSKRVSETLGEPSKDC